jgi:hypothetical protein
MKNLHKWDLSYAQAIELQKSLAPQVRFTPLITAVSGRPGLFGR